MFNIQRLGSRLGDRKGQTAAEYALLMAGIGLAAFAGYAGLGNSTNSAVSVATALISGSNPGSGTSSSAGSGTTTGSGTGTGSSSGTGYGGHHDGDREWH